MFGSIAGALAASHSQQIRALDGDAASVAQLSAFKMAIVAALQSHLSERPLLNNWSTVLDYLRFHCGHAKVEHFRLLLLDTKLRLIRDDLMGEGTIDEAPVYVREVMHRALDAGAASILLVHNHPSGDCTPSRSDINLTRRIIDAGKALNVGVIDHVIISASSHASLRSLGLL